MHPRVAMRILRHARIDVTMNVYTEVPTPRRTSGSEGSSTRSRCCTLLL